MIAAVVAAVICLPATLPATAHGASKPVYPGAARISVRAPTTKAGDHPVLRWKSAAGVVAYQLVVQTPKGRPYWTARTTETAVRFGGGPLSSPQQTEGASLTAPMRWFVLGFDAEGHVVAASAKRPIAP